MALTRSFLKGMGLTDEQVSAIVEAHTDTVDGLKASKKALETKLAEAEEKAKNVENNSDSEWKEKYEKEHSDFEAYKAEETAKAEVETKKRLYEQLLKDANVSEKRIASILKITDVSQMKVDKDGKLEKADELKKNIETEYADFITSVSTKGEKIATPPASSGKTMSKDDILKIKDTQERQKAISENLDLFV